MPIGFKGPWKNIFRNPCPLALKVLAKYSKKFPPIGFADPWKNILQNLRLLANMLTLKVLKKIVLNSMHIDLEGH